MTPEVVDSSGLWAWGDMFTALHGIGVYFGLIGAPKQVTTQTKPNVVRFGLYEFAPHTQELRKAGIRIRLEGQPLAILQMLLERPGELIVRAELQKRLWPTDTFVDFEHSLNAAVKRLRAALNDSADEPRYVETLARRGYRFIAPLNAADAETGFAASVVLPSPVVAHVPPIVGGRRVWLFAIAAFALAVGGWGWRQWRHRFAAPVPMIRSLAVLPLTNLSGDPSQEYLSEGMTEELIGRLSHIQGLRVISRTSAMHFKNTRLSVPEIARMLGVDAIIEGSVIREGSRIRVHAQLIRAATDEHFWSETYDRELRDALTLESEVAQSVAEKVKVTVTGQERQRLAAARSVSPEVYESYLKGLFALDKSDSKSDIEQSIGYFEEAIKKDPAFAPAYLGLATSYNDLGSSMIGAPSKEVRPKAVGAARKALELDPELAGAHVLLGDILQKQWQWADAEAEYRRALELNPSDPDAHDGFSRWLLCQGRTEEALEWAHRGRALDPLAVSGDSVGWILYNARRYDEAIQEFRSVLAVRPDEANALWSIGIVLIADHQPGEAIPILEKGLSVSERSPGIVGVLVAAYAQAGQRADALRLLAELRQRKQVGDAGALVYAYLGLGDRDQAFAWFEQAYRAQSNIMQWLKVNPLFDLVRDDPRFKNLLSRVGLA